MKVSKSLFLICLFLFFTGTAEAWTRTSSTMDSTFYETRAGEVGIAIGCYPGATRVGFIIRSADPFLVGPTQARSLNFDLYRSNGGVRRYNVSAEYFFGKDESWVNGDLPFIGNFEPFASANTMTVFDNTSGSSMPFLTVGMRGSAAAIAAILETCPAARR